MSKTRTTIKDVQIAYRTTTEDRERIIKQCTKLNMTMSRFTEKIVLDYVGRLESETTVD